MFFFCVWSCLVKVDLELNLGVVVFFGGLMDHEDFVFVF